MNVDTGNQLDKLCRTLQEEGRFDAVELLENGVRCRARDVESEASYSLLVAGEHMTIQLGSPDRWLNESIEADVEHSGDDLGELIEEELLDLDFPIERTGRPVVKHYRNDDRIYIFESDIPIRMNSDEGFDTACKWLYAYEAAFRELGDMGGPSDD